MKKRALAVMLAGVMVLGAQTGVWAASDTSDQKEGELTLLMTNSWIDESGASSEEFLKVIKQYEEENPGVKITLQGASQQDIKESFQTAALAGGGADIVVMDNSGHAIDLAAMGLLYPLEELTTDEELTAQYQEGPLNSGKLEGNIIQYHGIWTVQAFIIIQNAWMSWELMFLQHGKNFRMQ